MIKNSAFRIALGSYGVSIWSPDIFADTTLVRAFLSRAFEVREVGAVELRRAESFGRIRYDVAAHPARIWKKLSQALTSSDEPSPASARERAADAGSLYLDGPHARPIRVSRIGNLLSSWRVQQRTDDTLSLSHPVLRNDRGVVFRLEEELSSVFGVVHFRASAISGRVSIRFDRTLTTAERVARALEKAWPRLLDGIDGPPSRKRFLAALGLVGLAYTGQYVVPALRPVALAGVTLYSSPNVVKAAKQLTRGEIGVSALYSTGLTFMLFSGLPFTASVMAAFMQLWPQLAHRRVMATQRRVLARLRRRPAWARIVRADGTAIEVDADDLRKDGRVLVRRGETIPVDGVVESGSAIVVDGSPFRDLELERRGEGDAVVAGAFVRDGELVIRIERVGVETVAGQVTALLPRQPVAPLPSVLEAERIANRNAKPALALCALTLLTTRTALPAQAVIRPDYATATRLSAQLVGVEGVAGALLRGVLFKNPAALDHLAAVDLYVIDATAGLDRREMQVARVQTIEDVSPDLVIAYALAAQRGARNDLGGALSAVAAKRGIEPLQGVRPRGRTGSTRFHDREGRRIEIATNGYLAAAKIETPGHFRSGLVRRRAGQGAGPVEGEATRLWVLRDGKVVGVVSFARTGDVVGRKLVKALAERDPRARIIYASEGADSGSRLLAGTLGIEHSERTASDDRLRRRHGATLWIGNGRDPAVRPSIAASAVSVSVAPLPELQPFDDRADILLPRRGVLGIPDLIDIGRIHANRLAADYRTVYGANLLGVGAAFVLGWNTLQVGLLSNLGTGLVYARHALALSQLASSAEREHDRLKRAVLG